MWVKQGRLVACKNLALAHPWQKPNASTIGVGKDVMGGDGKGELSATCYYWGLELHTTQKVPIGLIHSSYGGSAVEDWISAGTLGDGKSGCASPCVCACVRARVRVHFWVTRVVQRLFACCAAPHTKPGL